MASLARPMAIASPQLEATISIKREPDFVKNTGSSLPRLESQGNSSFVVKEGLLNNAKEGTLGAASIVNRSIATSM